MPKAWNCCICNHTVYENGFDPCALILVTNCESPRAEQREQTFFGHAECFRQLPGPGGRLEIMEPDFATIGEMEAELGPEEDWARNDADEPEPEGI